MFKLFILLFCGSFVFIQSAQSQQVLIGGTYQVYFDRLSDEPFLNVNIGYSQAGFEVTTFYSHCLTANSRSFQNLGLGVNYKFFPIEAKTNLFIHADISTQIAGKRVGKPVQYDDYSVSSSTDYYNDQFLEANYQSLLGLGGCLRLGQFEFCGIYGLSYRKWSVYNGPPSSTPKSQNVSGFGVSIGMNYRIPIPKRNR